MKEPVTVRHPHEDPITARNPGPGAKTKEPEATPQQRLDAFVVLMQAQLKNNAPVSPAHIRELRDIAALLGGKKVVPEPHEFSKPSLVPQPDKILVVVSAEEALQQVRALSNEDRDMLHWQTAEKALLSAIDTGERLDAAQAAFDAAVVEQRRLHPADVADFERLPDGRVREDRFADRRPPVPPHAEPDAAHSPKP